jgi:hypothetical protein
MVYYLQIRFPLWLGHSRDVALRSGLRFALPHPPLVINGINFRLFGDESNRIVPRGWAEIRRTMRCSSGQPRVIAVASPRVYASRCDGTNLAVRSRVSGISGLAGMLPMTMAFKAKGAAMVTQVKEGDKVKVRVENVDGTLTIVKLEKQS